MADLVAQLAERDYPQRWESFLEQMMQVLLSCFAGSVGDCAGIAWSRLSYYIYSSLDCGLGRGSGRLYDGARERALCSGCLVPYRKPM